MGVRCMILLLCLFEISKLQNESEDSFKEGLIFKKKHHHLMKIFKNLKKGCTFFLLNICVSKKVLLPKSPEHKS